jgi:hypothetical protein
LSMQQMNNRGTCPLQVKTRVIEFIHVNKELPSSTNRGKSLHQILRKRFGTFQEAMHEYGLPEWERGTYGERFYKFPCGTVHSYNTRDMPQRDMFYQLMMQKCPVLSKT